jgi:hypothetical protein
LPLLAAQLLSMGIRQLKAKIISITDKNARKSLSILGSRSVTVVKIMNTLG